MLKSIKSNEIKEPLTISKDAEQNMSEILNAFFDDTSHIMATAQSFVENAMLGSSFEQSIGDNVHTFSVCAKFFRQMAGRIDCFRNVVKYGTQVLPGIKSDTFFNPGDLNQEVGDMLSIYASSKNIDIILENPYRNLGGELYLAFYDLDFLRQILLQFVSSVIGLAKEGTDLELKVEVKDVQFETSLTPDMEHYLSASIRSKMKMIFQVKYKGNKDCDVVQPLDEYYTRILSSKNGSIVSFSDNSHHLELHLPCFGIQFDNVSKTIGYFEIPGQMPYTLYERMLFTKNIRLFKAVLISSKRSKSIQQLQKYLKFWNADASCIQTSEKEEIVDRLLELSRDDNTHKYRHHLIIIEDVDNLAAILKQAILKTLFKYVIVVTSLVNYKQVSAKLYCLCEEVEISEKKPYVALTCCTCGPERLLSILRHCDDHFTESHRGNIVIRMMNETPPFGAFTQDVNEPQGELKKLVQDLANIQILVVDDDLTNRTILSNFLRQNHIKHDVVTTGKDALEIYKSKRHDIILMDLIMPEMDGIQATAEIRKFEKSIPGTFKTIIIAQTACLLDMEYDDALKAGCRIGEKLSTSSVFEMKSTDREENKIDGESGLSQVNAGSLSSLKDTSREFRINVRINRIEAKRLERRKPTDNDGAIRRIKKIEPESKDAGKSAAQIIESKRRLQTSKLNSDELVTNVRVGFVFRESMRRVEEQKKNGVWKYKRNEADDTTKAKQEDIHKLWNKVLHKNQPYFLHQCLVEQKKAIDDLLSTKTKLIQDYRNEIKSKDDEYVKELKRQSEEIELLAERMSKQYKAFQASFVEELELIEKAFVDERQDLISNDYKEIENLVESRRKNEGKFVEERANRVEEHIQQLEILRVQDSEEYNLVKIKLETDVQVLEQQLQQMRATYQLNTEKLEYNFQVLKKREEENGAIIGAQKRKINRLTDHLNSLRSKTEKQEKLNHQSYLNLTEDYKRITEQFKELQKKFRHFQVSDAKKYVEVWKMNEEKAMELMRKLVQANCVIHEQQLGISWKEPSEENFKPIDPMYFHDSGESEFSNIEQLLFSNKKDEDDGQINTELNKDERDLFVSKFKDQKNFSKSTKKMLELLCNETGFLIEDKLLKLLSPLHKDEQNLMKLDSIFKALGVETLEDVTKLSFYFTVKSENVDNSEEKLIHPNEVIKAIRRFFESQRNGSNTIDSQKTDHDDTLESDENNENSKNETRSAKVGKSRQELQREYWTRMSDIIDEKSFRVWNAVYVAMEKYNIILNERCNLTQEISAVQTQNEELKNLLKHYMSAKINQELQVPPTQIMLAQAGLAAATISIADKKP